MSGRLARLLAVALQHAAYEDACQPDRLERKTRLPFSYTVDWRSIYDFRHASVLRYKAYVYGHGVLAL